MMTQDPETHGKRVVLWLVYQDLLKDICRLSHEALCNMITAEEHAKREAIIKSGMHYEEALYHLYSMLICQNFSLDSPLWERFADMPVSVVLDPNRAREFTRRIPRYGRIIRRNNTSPSSAFAQPEILAGPACEPSQKSTDEVQVAKPKPRCFHNLTHSGFRGGYGKGL